MKNLIYVSILMLFMLFGCGGGGGTSPTSSSSASGAAVKGPFVSGSTVTAYKLESNGSRSSTTVTTTTSDGLGNYSLSGISWSGPTEIVIDGKYLNENSGSISSTNAQLSAIVNVTAGSSLSANINVFTDLEAKKIKTAMQNSVAFSTAKATAKSLIADMFDINLSSGTDFEDLNPLVGSGELAPLNAKLLRISAAIAQNMTILENLKNSVANANDTNDTNLSTALANLAQVASSINLDTVSQNLEQNLSLNDVPDSNDSQNDEFTSNTHVPTISNIPNVTINEDSASTTVNISASDADGDTITLSATISDENLATVSISGTTLTITPIANANGTATINVTAYDGKYTSAKDFILTVNPVNDAPVLADLDNITKTEDSPAFTVELNATDIDGDSITYSATSYDTNKATVSISGSTLTVTPMANANGDVTITVSSNDGHGGSDSKSFTLTLSPVNDAPVLANIADQTKDEDSSAFTISLNATDVDGDSITYSATSSDTNKATVSISGSTLTVTPVANANGDVVITVSANDGHGGSDSKSFTLTLNPVNDAPTITSANQTSIPENTIAVMTVTANDIDSDSLTFSIDGGNDASKFTIDGTSGALSFKTAPDYENPTDANSDNDYIVTVGVSDGDKNATKTITVTVTDVVDTLSGNVADGYVRDASVYVYTDEDMTNLIGTGTTDSNGDFNISLNTTPSTNTLYIGAEGGTIIDIGMPAPSMYLIADISGGEIHVTPITSTIYNMVVSGTPQNDAESELQTSLGFSGTTELYADPVANSGVGDAMFERIISSNTMNSTLLDGNYSVVISEYDLSDINDTINNTSDIASNITTLLITIENGEINGSVQGENSEVTGYVSGTTVAMKIQLLDENLSLSVAGSIGIFGSSVGVLSTQDANTHTQYQGVYAAQFIPEGITPAEVSAIMNYMIELAQMPQNMLLRLYIGDGSDMGIADINTTAVSSDLNLTVQNTILTVGDGSTQLLEANSSDSRFITLSSGFPTNLAVRKYAVHEDSTSTSSIDSTAYVIQAIGVRKAIAVVTNNTNKIVSVGDAYLSTSGAVAPYLSLGTTYSVYIGVAHGGMVGQPRSAMLNQQMVTDSDETLNLGNGAGYLSSSVRIPANDPEEDDVWFINGSTIGIYYDPDGSGLTDINDSMSGVQLYQSGAFDGEQINGGMIDSIALKNYPGIFVGYLKESNRTPAEVFGTFSYLSRALKVSNPINGLPMSRGTITFTNNGATMNIDGTNIALQKTFVNGMYHIEGSIGSQYIDILWPTGGKKAIYAISTSSSGTVVEVGEAYISR